MSEKEYEYPSDAQLKVITNWQYTMGWKNLVAYVEALWWTPSFGFSLSRGKAHIFDRQVIKLQLHTGGWSGNEDIIDALQHNYMFWSMSFYKQIRGGHFWFDIDKTCWEKSRTEAKV